MPSANRKLPRANSNSDSQSSNSFSPTARRIKQPSIAQDIYPSPSHMAGKIVADFYQWPVFFAILPPILTLYYGGKIEEWSEGFMLLVIAFYLYGLIKSIFLSGARSV